jgi:RecA-family ATPase
MSAADLDRHIEVIARHLASLGYIGDWNKALSKTGELRFGKHGSLSVIIAGNKTGQWYDYENKEGGGAWQLLRSKAKLADQDIPQWLERELGIRRDDDNKSRQHIAKIYNYVDEDGELLFQVLRYGPQKKFAQRAPDGKGGWRLKPGRDGKQHYTVEGVRQVLYHLPQLVEARKTGNGHPWRVFVCEGEKDADRLAQWGLTTTTNPGGAGKWRSDYNKFFIGAEIVILADNDEPGRRHANAVAAALLPVAVVVKNIELGGLADKGDVSDWIAAGGTQSDFETLVELAQPFHTPPETPQQTIDDPNSPPWDHPLAPWHHLDLVRLQGIAVPVRRWIVPGWVPALETTGLSGPGGDGKTLLAQMLATAAALGKPWLGIELAPIKTFLVLCEDREADIHIRQVNINRLYECDFADLANMRPVPRRADAHNRLMIFDRDGVGHLTTFFFQLLEQVKAFGAELTILDTRADLFLGNQNDEDQARTFIRLATDRIAEETGGACLLIYHPSRAGMRDGSGEAGSVQWDAAFRSRVFLQRAKPEEDAPEDPYARVLTRKKSNFALRDETIEMKWEDGVFIRTDTPEPSGIFASIQKQKAERVFLELVRKTAGEGQHVSNSSNAGNYAPKIFAGRPDSERVSKKHFVGAMKTLFAQNKIRMEPYGYPSKGYSRIVTIEK